MGRTPQAKYPVSHCNPSTLKPRFWKWLRIRIATHLRIEDWEFRGFGSNDLSFPTLQLGATLQPRTQTTIPLAVKRAKAKGDLRTQTQQRRRGNISAELFLDRPPVPGEPQVGRRRRRVGRPALPTVSGQAGCPSDASDCVRAGRGTVFGPGLAFFGAPLTASFQNVNLGKQTQNMIFEFMRTDHTSHARSDFPHD